MIIAFIMVVNLESFLKVKFQSGLSLLAGLSLPPSNFVVLLSDGTPRALVWHDEGRRNFLEDVGVPNSPSLRLYVVALRTNTITKMSWTGTMSAFLQEPCVEIVQEN